MLTSLCVFVSLLIATGVDGQSESPSDASPRIAETAAAQLDEAIDDLRRALPQTSLEFVPDTAAKVSEAAAAVMEAAVIVSRFDDGVAPEQLLIHASTLVRANRRIEAMFESAISLRTGFAELPEGSQRRDAAREFLAVSAVMTDLAGRFRYALFDPDALDYIEWELVESPALYRQLLDLFIETECTVGATIAAGSLVYPLEKTADNDEVAIAAETKSHILQVIAATGAHNVLDQLAEFLNSDTITPSLVIDTAETIRLLGLPQTPRPNQDPTLPRPAILPRDLQATLREMHTAALNAAEYHRRSSLLTWLNTRIETGLEEATYHLGQYDVHPGDWLLMRNPSPYNLFTDLSPGLYTHVGVVALEEGTDGVRRMVVVDLPERGTHMPATNVDLFVQRTLDYLFLRAKDQTIADTMGDVAATVIGNPIQFDLTFRTENIVRLRGKPLTDQKITGYCAGLLLLCAQETDEPREAFFPIPEYPAGGRLLENIGTLGLSVGDDFVSPTGALFSTRLDVVGRSEPMYDPRREVEQVVYDYFASSLETRTLTPSSDLYQSLRLKVAQMSSANSLLSKALAQAAGVGSETDLVTAARAAAVVETLDEIAYGVSGEFLEARDAVQFSGADASQDNTSQNNISVERRTLLQKRHADLMRLWKAEELSPRQLRIELVEYYIQRGQQQIDDRFFSDD